MKDLDAEKVELLGHYLAILPERWAQMQNYVAVYLSLITSLLAGMMVALDLFQGSISYFIAVLLGPVLICVFAQFAKTTVRKQAKNVRELIVLLAKIEYELGLYAIPVSDDSRRPWPKDETFMPPCWVRSRQDMGEHSDDFINSLPDSTGLTAIRLFKMLQVSSVLIAGAALAWTLR